MNKFNYISRNQIKKRIEQKNKFIVQSKEKQPIKIAFVPMIKGCVFEGIR
jgi:hypothetical protein